MTTTAGSYALAGSIAPKDSFVAQKLREAGAVLLGKAKPERMGQLPLHQSSSGWSGRGGQARNPYALDRNPCGSSSGSAAAVSANYCPVAIGTRDGRIHRVSLVHVRDRGHQADPRAREPGRHHPHRPQPGYRWAAGAHGRPTRPCSWPPSQAPIRVIPRRPRASATRSPTTRSPSTRKA
jgi:hypothetical protein